MNTNGTFKVGDKVISKAGSYAPVTYGLNGEELRHTLGDVVEVHANFVAVRFVGYQNIVDMLNRELQHFFVTSRPANWH